MNAARPLDRFPLVRAHHVDSAQEAFSAIYSNKMKVESIEGDRAIDVIINNCQLSDVGLNYTGYGTDVRIRFCGSKFVTLSFPYGGQGRLTINGTERTLGPERGLLTPAETGFSTELIANYQHVVLRLDPKALENKLAAIIGMAVKGPLQFEPIMDFSSGSAKLLRDHLCLLVDMVSVLPTPLPDLVQAEFEQTIMVMFLHASRHGYSHLLEADAPDSAPAEVGRAEAYIETNWQRPITLEDLAAVTGTSALSLFRSFMKYRGYSPMQFAERLRNRKQSPS